MNADKISMVVVDALIVSLLEGVTSAIPVLQDAIEAGIDTPKGVSIHISTRKAWKRHGIEHAPKRINGHFAIVDTKAKTIRIFGIDSPNAHDAKYSRVFDRTFAIGDMVEYDSYNFSYHGPIVAIGAGGSVTVNRAATGKSSNTRMDLDSFSRRNWDLNLAAAADRNADVMQSI